MEQNRSSRAITDFREQVKAMIGTNAKAYKSYPSTRDVVRPIYELQEIRDILALGDPVMLRELSRFYYRASGIYRMAINTYASLLLYDYVMVPQKHASLPKSKFIKRYETALQFLDDMNIAANLHTITHKILLQGVYFGLLRRFGDRTVIQELPVEFCRTRYKNEHDVDILEFNLRYFDALHDTYRETILNMFPKDIVRQYRQRGKSAGDSWITVDDSMGIAFYFGDQTPLFAPAIPQLFRLEEAGDREAEYDAEELQKILINHMPIINNTHDTVFSMEETAVMHDGLVNMLKDNKYIDVLTTYGDAKLEQAQDTSGQAQRNNLEKFTESVYNYLGISGQLFNAEGNTALKYSTNKDTAIMYTYSRKFANWLTFIINRIFGDSKLTFDVDILPTTMHNRADMMDLYLKGAQYGYSKIYTAVAQGIKQSNLISLVEFENDVLDLDEKMIPLQSSHTASNSAEKSGEDTSKNHKSGEPGRPELDDANKSDKTIANRDAM